MAAVEQAAIAGALSAGLLADPNRAIEAAHATGERLNRLAPEHERNWQGEVIAGEGLVFRRTRQSVDERHLIDAALLRSAEARRLDAENARLREVYEGSGTLAARDKTWPITGPVSPRRGGHGTGPPRHRRAALQRPGEMNPNQLWETTLDPEIRSLLQLKISHADSAEETFSTLMGDLVEPRRDFIQANALNVANLDV